MGLNLLGCHPARRARSNSWRNKVPALVPVAAGWLDWPLPPYHPVLAVLWGLPRAEILVVVLLSSLGLGQVLPLLLAGTFAAAVSKPLALRPIGRWVPDQVVVTTGVLTLLVRWS